MPVDADILIVAATLLSGLSLASVVSGWAVRTWPWIGLGGLAVGIALFVYVHMRTDGGLTWVAVPDAFIEVAARILN